MTICDAAKWLQDQYRLTDRDAENAVEYINAELADEVERLTAIVNKLPKDADGDPIESGKPYWFPRGDGGAIRFFASLEPCTHSQRAYVWHEARLTSEAAIAAAKAAGGKADE